MNFEFNTEPEMDGLDPFIHLTTDNSRMLDHQDSILGYEIFLPKKESIAIQDSLFQKDDHIPQNEQKSPQKEFFTSNISVVSTSGCSESLNNSLFRKCTCTKSRCLKNYCECFKLGIKCNQECECRECKNQVQLFIIPTHVTVEKIRCKCKKSRCLKRYCECHSMGKKCGRLCNCQECGNGEQQGQKQGQQRIRKRVKSDPFIQYEDYLK